VTVDVVPPPSLSVLSTNPQTDAAGVMVKSTIAATFSDQIDPSYSYFTVTGPSGAVAGNRAVNGSTVIFTPQNHLDYNATYTVTLPSNMRAPSGSSLVSDYAWSFTTMAAPLLRVQSTFPVAGTTNVPTYSALPNISATFNRPLSLMSISSSSFFVSSPSGLLMGTLAVDGSTVSLWYDYYLAPNTLYTATLTTAISDTSGHTLPFDYVWTFTTGN
jgi:Bacterial Ig-like domain